MNKQRNAPTLSAIAASALLVAALATGKVLGKTRDISFGYRMPGGFAGDINRAHPFSVESALMHQTTPVLLYGNACLLDTATNSVRQIVVGDVAVTRLYGVIARDYPTQQQSGGPNAVIGTAVPPINLPASVLRYGYIMVRVNGTPTKDGLVYVWGAANSGNHVQGTFEAAATGGSTLAIANARFNGPPDSSGVCELLIWEA